MDMNLISAHGLEVAMAPILDSTRGSSWQKQGWLNPHGDWNGKKKDSELYPPSSFSTYRAAKWFHSYSLIATQSDVVAIYIFLYEWHAYTNLLFSCISSSLYIWRLLMIWYLSIRNWWPCWFTGTGGLCGKLPFRRNKWPQLHSRRWKRDKFSSMRTGMGT